MTIDERHVSVNLAILAKRILINLFHFKIDLESLRNLVIAAGLEKLFNG